MYKIIYRSSMLAMLGHVIHMFSDNNPPYIINGPIDQR